MYHRAQVNKNLHGSLDAITTEIIDFEKQMKGDLTASKRQIEGQVVEATSSLLKVAALSEITAKTASDRITSWLSGKV